MAFGLCRAFFVSQNRKLSSGSAGGLFTAAKKILLNIQSVCIMEIILIIKGKSYGRKEEKEWWSTPGSGIRYGDFRDRTGISHSDSAVYQ